MSYWAACCCETDDPDPPDGPCGLPAEYPREFTVTFGAFIYNHGHLRTSDFGCPHTQNPQGAVVAGSLSCVATFFRDTSGNPDECGWFELSGVTGQFTLNGSNSRFGNYSHFQPLTSGTGSYWCGGNFGSGVLDRNLIFGGVNIEGIPNGRIVNPTIDPAGWVEDGHEDTTGSCYVKLDITVGQEDNTGVCITDGFEYCVTTGPYNLGMHLCFQNYFLIEDQNGQFQAWPDFNSAIVASVAKQSWGGYPCGENMWTFPWVKSDCIHDAHLYQNCPFGGCYCPAEDQPPFSNYTDTWTGSSQCGTNPCCYCPGDCAHALIKPDTPRNSTWNCPGAVVGFPAGPYGDLKNPAGWEVEGATGMSIHPSPPCDSEGPCDNDNGGGSTPYGCQNWMRTAHYEFHAPGRTHPILNFVTNKPVVSF